MDKQAAASATRTAAILAYVSAALTTLVVTIALGAGDGDGKLSFFADPWNFVDVVLILACGVGVHCKSRVAAILLFVYFLLAKLVMALEQGVGAGLGVAVVFAYYYARGIQGAFVYHRIRREEDPSSTAITGWTYAIGVPAVCLGMLVIGLGTLSLVGVVPPTRVLSGAELAAGQLDTLREGGVLMPEDQVLHAYFEGLTVMEAGSVLTHDRVITYQTDPEGELEIYELPLSEVTGIVRESAGGVMDDASYRVTTADPDRWLILFLSPEDAGDERFAQAVRERI